MLLCRVLVHPYTYFENQSSVDHVFCMRTHFACTELLLSHDYTVALLLLMHALYKYFDITQHLYGCTCKPIVWMITNCTVTHACISIASNCSNRARAFFTCTCDSLFLREPFTDKAQLWELSGHQLEHSGIERGVVGGMTTSVIRETLQRDLRDHGVTIWTRKRLAMVHHCRRGMEQILILNVLHLYKYTAPNALHPPPECYIQSQTIY